MNSVTLFLPDMGPSFSLFSPVNFKQFLQFVGPFVCLMPFCFFLFFSLVVWFFVLLLYLFVAT